MINILDITGEDIAKLNDADLRTLVGLLCEAEYRRYNLSTDKIMWGGHQDAPDGGLDVIINDTDAQAVHNGFIPRKFTGFQVKRSAMTTSKIKTEMKPKGLLRDSIKEIIRQKGAYIIIDSQSSLTGNTLEDRIQTMGSCIAKEADAANCHLDFYDKGRIATWVRTHPSLIFWVKNKIGSGTTGWKAYGNWANPKAEADEEYILDDKARLHYEGDVLPIIDGIKELSEQLSKSKSSVRLVGLSGVGKTRLVQALFDQRIHKEALNTYEVVYTDISLDPQPSPGPFAHQLVSGGERLILIIDNCSPELHRALTTICSEAASKISLLTIEYDVRDDLPEETEVFKLEPASKDVVLNIIQKQYPDIGHPNAERITEFSDGNARIALYLAKTIDKGDTLSGLSDKALFERLFYQRNDVNKELEKAAEVCSLVYSFDGVGISESSELNILASLIEKTSSWLYGNVQELIRRNLVQSRGNMRAMLPQAIADRLACSALDSIHPTKITECFKSSPERLLISFTRRLSYLHYNQNAVEIAEDWLSEKGDICKNIDNLNKFGIKLFENLAPVSQDTTLEAIERAAKGTNKATFLSRENTHYTAFVRILKKLAYEPELFVRSTDLICAFALSERENENINSIRNTLKELFHIYLSGTNATAVMRAEFLKKLLNSALNNERRLGIALLKEALQTQNFYGHSFEFGSRKRNYGYSPRNIEELKAWYTLFLNLAMEYAINNASIRSEMRKLLAQSLSELYQLEYLRDFLKEAILQIHDEEPWNDGWREIKRLLSIKHFAEDPMLRELEQILKPTDLLDRVKTYVLGDQYADSHIDYYLVDNYNRSRSIDECEQEISILAKSLGKSVANDKETLKILLPELVTQNSNKLFDFGSGLAEEYQDYRELLRLLCDTFKNAEPSKHCVEIIIGALCFYETTYFEYIEALLDAFVYEEVFCEWFPYIQCALSYNAKAIERLVISLDLGKAPVDSFRCIVTSRIGEQVTDKEFAKILSSILKKDNGVYVATDILSLYLLKNKNDLDKKISKELVSVAISLLCKHFPFENYDTSGHYDYRLSVIVEQCFPRINKKIDIRDIGISFLARIKDHFYMHYYPKFLIKFAENQPEAFLDIFVGCESIDSSELNCILRIHDDDIDNPLENIPEEVILKWCDIEPEKRYSLAASALPFIINTNILNPVCEKIFQNAPDINKILNNINIILHPMVYSPPLSEIIKRKLPVLEQLFEHENSAVKEWAKEKHREISEKIQREIAREKEEISRRSETFE